MVWGLFIRRPFRAEFGAGNVAHTGNTILEVTVSIFFINQWVRKHLSLVAINFAQKLQHCFKGDRKAISEHLLRGGAEFLRVHADFHFVGIATLGAQSTRRVTQYKKCMYIIMYK